MLHASVLLLETRIRLAGLSQGTLNINAILPHQRPLMLCVVLELAKDPGIVFTRFLCVKFAVIQDGRISWKVAYSGQYFGGSVVKG